MGCRTHVDHVVAKIVGGRQPFSDDVAAGGDSQRFRTEANQSTRRLG
jgi:hypothetical protein